MFQLLETNAFDIHFDKETLRNASLVLFVFNSKSSSNYFKSNLAIRMSSTNLSFDYNDTSNQSLSCNNSLSGFLLKTRPELIQMIPIHWLQQDHMTYDIQILVGIVLFIICAPTNIGHLLVFATYAR